MRCQTQCVRNPPPSSVADGVAPAGGTTISWRFVATRGPIAVARTWSGMGWTFATS